MKKTTKTKKVGRGTIELEIFNGQPMVVITIGENVACIACHKWSIGHAGEILGIEISIKELKVGDQKKLEL